MLTSSAASAILAVSRQKAGRFSPPRAASIRLTPASRTKLPATSRAKSRQGSEVIVPGSILSEEFQIESEMKDHHADQGHAPRDVDRGKAGRGARGFGG